jgi:hypothetical protein
MRNAALVFSALLVASTASAQTSSLKGGLQGIDFLVGHWSTPTRGKVADTGGGSSGESNFTPEVGGSVLLRKDHVSLYDAAGKPSGGFDIMMMIYPEAGGIHADYADGDHIIHYTSATVTPGQAVTFVSAPSPTTPTFKLSYVLSKPKVIDIDFSMAAPGSTDFHPIATGSATKDR